MFDCDEFLYNLSTADDYLDIYDYIALINDIDLYNDIYDIVANCESNDESVDTVYLVIENKLVGDSNDESTEELVKSKTVDDYVKDINDAGNDKDLENILNEIDENGILENKIEDMRQIFKNNRYSNLDDKKSRILQILDVKTETVDKSVEDRFEQRYMSSGNDFTANKKIEALNTDSVGSEIVIELGNKIYAKLECSDFLKNPYQINDILDSVLIEMQKDGYKIDSTDDIQVCVYNNGKLYYNTLIVDGNSLTELENICDKLNKKKTESANKLTEDINGDSIKETDVDNSEEDNVGDIKTTLDYLQDRIGQKMSLGEFNTTLQSLFGRYNEVFILFNDIYNMDKDEPQELVVSDDDDLYTITYNIVDIMNGTIEITDVTVE